MLETRGKAAVVQAFQHFFGTLLLIGVVTGVLSLIPGVGWVLGVLVFILAMKYTQRETFSIDVITTLAVWMALRVVALQLHIL